MKAAAFYTGLVILYILLAVLHSYPLARDYASHLTGTGLGDNVSFVWNLWWMREALASPDYDFFRSPFLFAPLGVPLVLHTHTAMPAFLSATLLGFLPVVSAQNVVLIASLALNGLAAYSLAMTVTTSRYGSAFAGAVFIVSPAITGRLMGHYNFVVAWPLVFACVALLRWWQRRAWPRGVVLAIAAAVLAYTDYYYLTYFLLFAVVHAFIQLLQTRLRFERREQQRSSYVAAGLSLFVFALAIGIAVFPADQIRIGSLQITARSPTNALTLAWILAGVAAVRRWKVHLDIQRRVGVDATGLLRSALVPAAVFFALSLPIAASAWTLIASGDYVSQASSLKSGPKGVDLATLIMGPPHSGVIGSRVRAVYDRLDIDSMESSLWLGIVVPIVAVLGARRQRREPAYRHWVLVGVCFGLWALGPYLMIFGTNTGLLLPQALAHYVPVLSNARIPGRAIVMVDLSMVIIIAIFLANASTPRLRLLLGLVMLVGVVERLATPLPVVAVGQTGVYARIVADRGPAAVLPLPLGIRDGFGERGLVEHDAMFAQTIHRHPLMGGFVARMPPRVSAWYESNEPYRTLLALSRGATVEQAPTCDAIVAGLTSAHVSYVVLYRADASPLLQSFVDRRMPLTMVAQDDARTLFVVDPTHTNCRD